jgi:hypothetical protein
MSLREIARYDEQPVGPKVERVRRRQPRLLNRRNFLERTMLVGSAVGVSLLGIFPPAKRAEAACVGFLENNQILNGCVAGHSGGCWPGCGPSDVYDGACSAEGWHLWAGSWRNRPDDCAPGSYPEADGWYWWLQCACGEGYNKYFRCHDGCFNPGSGWVNSICRVAWPGCL